MTSRIEPVAKFINERVRGINKATPKVASARQAIEA